MKEAKEFLISNKLISDNDFVVIALSGGPDSMALLNIILELREIININIVCAHVNHNVRKESDDEKIFVEKYCKDNNVIFEYMKINNYPDGNFEMIARCKRYEFFNEIVQKYNAKVLLTAHHGDDLMETILMRLVRGSSLKGYGGFDKITDVGCYKIVRPLIYYTKEDILKYLKNNNIPFVIDESNNSDKYTRNRYRHNILPLLKKEDAFVHRKFLKFSESVIECANYVDKMAMKEYEKLYINNSLDLNEFNLQDEIIKKRIISYILKEIYKDDITLIKDDHIKILLLLINDKKPNKSVNFPKNIVVSKQYDKLIFSNFNFSEEYNIKLDKDVTLYSGKKILFLKEEDDDSNYVCRLNSKDVTLPLYVRSKINGDKIEVKNLNGSKKVKDIFIDSKIALNERKTYPIVVDSNNIVVWIPGLKKSKYNKEKNEKYDIILKYD